MYKIISVAGVLLLLSACSTKNNNINKSLISGYEWEHYLDTDNPSPNVGDFVYFQMDIRDDRDSLLQSYRNQKQLPSVQILDPTDINRKKNPMVDIVSNLAVGDSAAILVPVDSVPSMPPGLEYTKHIEYHIAVKEILTEEENDARAAEEQRKQATQLEEMRALLPEIEALTETTLAQYNDGTLEVEETPRGVKYHIHERGAGELPTDQRMVTMNYYGRTVEDGARFDDSFSRGRGYSFRLGPGAVIQGWHEAARYLPLGTKASVFIPSELGYGAQGSPPNIPPGAELYFYLEVAEIFY